MNYLNTDQVAEILQLSPRTIEKFRLTGEGPDFHKFGRRCLYSIEDIERWTESRRRSSTSDPGTDANI